MIKPHESPGRLIDPGDVRPFMPVAVKTGEGQIVQDRLTAVLACHDVINMEW
jgi:hypothetical protein